jgi:hypothetical protein
VSNWAGIHWSISHVARAAIALAIGAGGGVATVLLGYSGAVGASTAERTRHVVTTLSGHAAEPAISVVSTPGQATRNSPGPTPGAAVRAVTVDPLAAGVRRAAR